MHRSGTSAIAAALEALGLGAGEPALMMRADAANPAGYYELQEIGDLNDEILARLGGGWGCPPQPADGWELEPAMTAYVHRAATIVRTRLAKDRWLVKDPRISLLLPLWRRAVLDRCAAILVVRDPREVAWSLALRDGLPFLSALALWSEYYGSALSGLGGLPVYVCSYDALVTDPTDTLRALAASLTSWPELPADVDLDAAAARLRPELRRNTWPRDTADAPEIPTEVEGLRKVLIELEGSHDVFQPGCPPASPWEQALLAERRAGAERLRLSDETVGRLAAELEAVHTRLAEVHSDLEKVQARRRESERELRRSMERWERLERRFPMRAARAVKRRARAVFRRR